MNHVTITVLILAALVLGGCPSATLSPAERISDIIACEAAIVAAGLPLVQAISDKESSNPQKAGEAQEIITKANALPACLKVGANAATVLGEQKKMRGLMK